MLAFILMMTISSSTLAGDKSAELNSEAALKYVNKVLACGKKNGWKLSAAVVNSEGNLMAFVRDDGSYVGSIDASIQKAVSSNAFQRPTSAFVQGIKDGRTGLVTVKNVTAIEGGVPIVISGKHLGAIGVSGAKATEDEQCAKEALEK